MSQPEKLQKKEKIKTRSVETVDFAKGGRFEAEEIMLCFRNADGSVLEEYLIEVPRGKIFKGQIYIHGRFE